MTRRGLVCLGVILTTVTLAPDAAAQPLGTFRWQLEPYCNVVTVAVTQNGAVYRLEGTDDQCGNGADAASVVGMAFPNADGTIGFGLTIVTTPGGEPLHVDAAITLATLGVPGATAPARRGRSPSPRGRAAAAAPGRCRWTWCRRPSCCAPTAAW